LPLNIDWNPASGSAAHAEGRATPKATTAEAMANASMKRRAVRSMEFLRWIVPDE
jgi:hypothetical protein